MTPLHSAVLEALGGGGALFFRMLSDRVAACSAARLPSPTRRSPPRSGTWSGPACSPTTRSARCGCCSAAAASSAARGRARAGPRRGARPAARGRRPVRLRPAVHADADRAADGQRPVVAAAGAGRRRRHAVRAHALALTLLDRHGVLTRGAVAAERIAGGFAAVYPVLRAMEEAGQCRRGYFVEGLGAAQFALPGAVDRMRALADPGGQASRSPERALVLAAADPAQPYGAALPWPDRPGETPVLAPAGPQGGRAGRPGGRRAGRCTSSAAAGPCCPGPTTRSGWRPRGGAGRRGPRRRARAADGGTRRRGAGGRRLAADAGAGGGRVPPHPARAPDQGRASSIRPVMREQRTSAIPAR